MRQGVDRDHDWQNVDPAGERVSVVTLPAEQEQEQQGGGRGRGGSPHDQEL
jgi:hypothetical protein